MLVIISDLHFEEEESNYINSDGVGEPIRFSRNLSRKAFELVICRLAQDAERGKSKNLDLVFAGDIFDIHRTGLWFTENPKRLRPYVSNNAVVGIPELEEMLLLVLERIQAAQGVQDVLEVFRLLAGGQYYLDGELKDFPAQNITFYYIPGNHDRLINATPSLRNNARRALGMAESDEPFPNILTFPQYHTLVRHGHEYDPINFAADLTTQEQFPLDIKAEIYAEAPLGDLTTVDIASHIPYLIRNMYEKEEILTDPILRAIYLRLLEFDDLRPQSALFNYLLNMPPPEGKSEAYWKENGPEEVWEKIKPVMRRLLEEIHDDPFLRGWLRKMNKIWRFDVIDVVQLILALGLWRLLFHVPLSWLQKFSTWIVGRLKGRPGPQVYAAREEAVKKYDYHFVVAGHTHHPATELILSDEEIERYYIDTGTWRNQVPATPKFDAFGRLKALTYVVIYNSEEDKGTGKNRVEDKFASIDFWSGVTQRWKRPSS